jgi:Tfp pilus assembly protein PilF/TolB-like protein
VPAIFHRRRCRFCLRSDRVSRCGRLDLPSATLRISDRWSRFARRFVIAVLCCLACTQSASAQYPFVPPPVRCIEISEGPGILAGIASTRASDVPERNLAILQFTQIPSSDEPDLALAGLRDRLVARLRQVRPTALREYVGPAELRSEVPVQRVLEARTLGKQFNARHLLAGRYSQDGGNVQVVLEGFDARSGKRLWQETRTGSLANLLALEPALANIIAAHELGELSASDRAALDARDTDDSLAYAHYVRGIGALEDTTRLRAANAELELATKRAPKLSVAWSALATAYTRSALASATDSASRDSLLLLAVEAADRAVSLAPRAANAWVARGTVLAGGQRLRLAREAFEHALSLQPSSAAAHRQLGRVLMLQGSASAAESHLLRAVALMPEDPSPLVDLGELELNQRAFGQSCRALDLALTMNPRLPRAYELRAMARLHRGEVRPAWIDAETGRRLGSELPGQAVAALVDVAAHDTVSARNRMRALRRRIDSSPRVTAYDVGYVALGLVAVGDRAGAIQALEGIRPRDGELYLILHRPGFGPLQSDDRFQRLLEAARAGVAR